MPVTPLCGKGRRSWLTSYAGFWIDPSDLTVRRTPQHGGLPGDADQGTPT